MAGLSIKQKKDYAKMLYLSGGLTQKEIAVRVEVSEKTISKWSNQEKWDDLRISLLVTKEEQLSSLYRQLDALKKAIENRDDRKYPTPQEGDIIIKLTASIKNLETDVSVAEKLETGKEFLRFVRKATAVEQATFIASLFDAYIKSCL